MPKLPVRSLYRHRSKFLANYPMKPIPKYFGAGFFTVTDTNITLLCYFLFFILSYLIYTPNFTIFKCKCVTRGIIRYTNDSNTKA